jgi:hypothetical protein
LIFLLAVFERAAGLTADGDEGSEDDRGTAGNIIPSDEIASRQIGGLGDPHGVLIDRAQLREDRLARGHQIGVAAVEAFGGQPCRPRRRALLFTVPTASPTGTVSISEPNPADPPSCPGPSTPDSRHHVQTAVA